jgi:hypothetical protein
MSFLTPLIFRYHLPLNGPDLQCEESIQVTGQTESDQLTSCVNAVSQSVIIFIMVGAFHVDHTV